MKKILLLICLPLLLAGSFTISYDFSAATSVAEAARFGGGRSIGRARPPVQAPSRQQQVAPAQRNATQAAPAAAAGGGLRSMLGPILAGSMLGALFFGGGFQGFGMADAALILLGVFLLNRFIRSRRQAAWEAAQAAQVVGQGNGQAAAGPEAYARSATRSGSDSPWERLRDRQNGQTRQDGQNGPSAGQGAPNAANSEVADDLVEPGLDLPPGFDARDFLAGAKVIFTRMQEAWDERDLADIAEFTTAAVLDDITRQAQEDPTPSRTDILLIKARLLDFQRQAGEETATVFFEVLLRERQDQANFEMREAWHFTRSRGGSWKLDGVQQVT